MKIKLTLLFVLSMAEIARASSGIGPTLPATCSTGDNFTTAGPPAQEFYCIGSNTWKPVGPSAILSLKKGVDLNTTNTDIPLAMPPGKFFARSILITNASVSLAATAARIGIWTGAGGTGANVATAASSGAILQALTSSAVVSEGNLNVQVTSSLTQVFLRCTIAHGSAATVDIYVLGEVIP